MEGSFQLLLPFLWLNHVKTMNCSGMTSNCFLVRAAIIPLKKTLMLSSGVWIIIKMESLVIVIFVRYMTTQLCIRSYHSHLVLRNKMSKNHQFLKRVNQEKNLKNPLILLMEPLKNHIQLWKLILQKYQTHSKMIININRQEVIKVFWHKILLAIGAVVTRVKRDLHLKLRV